MTSRAAARRARAEAKVLDACAEQQEKLAAAKAAHTAAPTPESLAALRQAMTEMHEFRAWLRSGSRGGA